MVECAAVASSQVWIRVNNNQFVEQPQTILQCRSEEEAIAHILKVNKPNIVAIGETHPYTDDGKKPTTLKLFVRTILPVLKDAGFNDLVLEMLYSDDASNRLVNRHLQTGKPENILKKVMYSPNGPNQFGMEELLITAKELKINLFGGGPRITDRETSYIRDIRSDKDKSGNKLIALTRRITQRTIEKALSLLKRPGPKKLITYNGGYHNDVVNTFGIRGFSFGGYFTSKTKFNYVEIDLLSPELMNSQGKDNYAYPEYENWMKTAVPQKGVMLIKRGNSSYTIMFPAKTLVP